MSFETLLVETPQEAPGVTLIRLNRPQALNALNQQLLAELCAALDAAQADANVRCVVLTGSERAFAAGADIKEMADKSYAQMFAEDVFGPATRGIEQFRKPLVAAVAGFALGGGCELAMLCDFIIAAETAKFGQPEINLGVMPGMGGTQRLPRLVGKARAMELCFTGKTIAFEEALDMGLVHYIYEKEGFMDQVMDYARQFIVPNKSSLAVGKVKRAIQTGLELSLPDGLAFERELLAQTFGSEDGQEGVKAYLEKRTAQFKGK